MVCHKGYLGITGPYKPDRTLYRGLSKRLSRYYWSRQTWWNSIPWSVTKAISVLLVQTNLTELYTVVCHKGYLGITGPDKPDRTLYHGLSQRLSRYYWSIQTWQNSIIPWSVTKAISVLLVHTNLIELYTLVCHKGYLGITGPYQPDRTLYCGLPQRLSQYYLSIQTWQNSIPWSVTKAISVLLVHTNLTELYTMVCHKGYLSITGPYKPDRTLNHGLSQRLSQHYWSIQTW